MAATITRAQLNAYIDDALGDRETAQVEQALRDSDTLRQTLRSILQERDRGEHSIGAIWRRQRLSCPPREQLGSYLLQVLEDEQQDYIDFHLKTIGCPFCQANLVDLQALQQEPEPQTRQRRQRIFESSAGYLSVGRDTRTK
jgi:hypothetical protein